MMPVCLLILHCTRKYNYHNICRARIVAENAYGRLKARWRRLMKRNDICIDNIPTIVTAACILYNVSEIHNETFNEFWLQEVEASVFPPPRSSAARDGSGDRPKQVRDAFVTYFST